VAGEVDFRVERRSSQVLMPQHLADRHQARASAQQLAGEGVSQSVWAHGRQAGSSAGPLDHVPDQVGADRPAGRPAGQKQPPGMIRAVPPGQVADQGLTDLGGQRQPVVPPSLAADDELAGPPIEIGQLQARDLDGAQAKPRDQNRDREVAEADFAVAVTAVQQ
jgi:hypothetical protein